MARRNQVRATPDQLETLQAAYPDNIRLKAKKLAELSAETGLPAPWIKSWFVRARQTHREVLARIREGSLGSGPEEEDEVDDEDEDEAGSNDNDGEFESPTPRPIRSSNGAKKNTPEGRLVYQDFSGNPSTPTNCRPPHSNPRRTMPVSLRAAAKNTTREGRRIDQDFSSNQSPPTSSSYYNSRQPPANPGRTGGLRVPYRLPHQTAQPGPSLPYRQYLATAIVFCDPRV
ncbi:hypothetical protein FB45DRAFT_896451 [Roridomyces roridus]|uniref:Homeobox domain-containing protein n=1 Tax=Roridomyces roridus TaxID=1738132 RepID=A0AAD7CB46_9AGAR|nr:hypothetical protein FB45DRAFT_896451 [Roridomyces roridus]